MALKTPYTFDKSGLLWEEAKQVIACGAQGTRQPLYPDYPVYVDRAKGCRMWDVDGNEFIDLLCSIGPVILGYAYKRVDDAARGVMENSFQSSTNHPLQIELAKVLIEMIPCAQRVRFLKTGTEATMAATRLVRRLTERTYIARHGYHGWTDMWRYGMTGGGIDQAACESIRPFDGTAEGLRKLFNEVDKPFAGVIMCPADTKPFTRENYQGIVDTAHEHGALVIFDEVKTGFRVAPGGAQEFLGVTPDITTISKGMGNGYPISAIVGKAEYMDRFNETPTAGTFAVEALSIAACLATVQEIREKNVTKHLWSVGQRLIDGLNRICENHGIEEAKAYADPIPAMPRFTWKPGTEDASHPAHQYFFSECLKYGLFFSPWHVAFVNYSHTDRDIDDALEICDFVMDRTKKNWKSSSIMMWS